MAVEFPCEQCQSELRIELKDVEKKARCPRCGMIQAVPKSVARHSLDDSAEIEAPVSQADPDENQVGENDPAFADDNATVYRAATPSGEAISNDEAASTTDDNLENSTADRWSMKTPDGSVYGPVDRPELDDWAQQGRISSQCLVRPEGKTHWQSALGLYPNLAGLRPHVESPVVATAQPRPAYSARQRFVDNTSLGLRGNSGGAICLLALIGLCTVMVPILSFIALLWSLRERNGIREGRVSADNRTLVDLGFVLSVVGVGIWCIWLFGSVFL